MALLTLQDPSDGEFAEDFTSLKWIYREHRDGETATFKISGICAFVRDCDGDMSFYHVKRGSELIAEGSDHGFTPHHFFKCLAEAEFALRAEVERRKHQILSTKA